MLFNPLLDSGRVLEKLLQLTKETDNTLVKKASIVYAPHSRTARMATKELLNAYVGEETDPVLRARASRIRDAIAF